MEVRQKFVVDRPLEVVWGALCDIRLVGSCVPGAEIVSVSDDGSNFEGRIRIKVGPISAAFSGSGRITRDDVAHRGQVEGSCIDRSNGSRVKINMTYSSNADQGSNSSATDIVANVTLTGPLAQFGKSALMNDISEVLVQEFTRNLTGRLGQTMEDTEVEHSASSVFAAPAELRLLKVLWQAIKARSIRLAGRAPKTIGR